MVSGCCLYVKTSRGDSTELAGNGTSLPLLRSAAVNGTAWLVGAGVVVTVIGFAKTIEPLIELGVALGVIGLLARPDPKA